MKNEVRDSLPLPTFTSASGLFLPTTHENEAIASIDHQRCRYYCFLHPSTLESSRSNLRCVFLNRAVEADRSMTSAIACPYRHLSRHRSYCVAGIHDNNAIGRLATNVGATMATCDPMNSTVVSTLRRRRLRACIMLLFSH